MLMDSMFLLCFKGILHMAMYWTFLNEFCLKISPADGVPHFACLD